MGYYDREYDNDLIYVVRIIVSCIVIFVSLAIVYIVILKVSSIKILEKINIKESEHNGINITSFNNNDTSLLITDENGIKFRKEDKSFAREEWIEKNGELFYFDTAGYGLNGDLKKEGQVYTFENGKLKSIRKDTAYVTRARSDLYSSVETAQYLVWLDSEDKEKNFYAIKYRIKNEDFEDYLGTENDKQYATSNMIKIYMSNIYYLSVGKGTSYAGRLYRMRPGAIHKETVGVGVTGFIVLSDDVVYYCDGERVLKAKSWIKSDIDEKVIEDENLEGIDETEIIPIISTKSEITNIDDNEEMVIPKITKVNIVESFFDNFTKKKDLNANETENVVPKAKEVKETETTENNNNELPDMDMLPIPDAEVKIVEETIDSFKNNAITSNAKQAVEPVIVSAPY